MNSLTGSVPSQFCSDMALTYLDIQNTDIYCYSKCLDDVNTLLPGDANSCYVEFVAAEGPALCDLYASTNIPTLVEQGIMGGWNCTNGQPVGEFCDWFGVYCGIDKSDDPAGGFADDIIVLNETVYEINLPSLKIEGTLPSSLSVLSYLLVLNVPDNNITGSIPPEFGNLRKLASMDVGYNSMTGSLPTTLGTWISMQELSLMNNSFTGEIPSYMGLMYSMYEFTFQNNNFEGAVPIELCNDTALNTLDISYNTLITCYANCLTSVPNFSNDLEVDACNYVSLPPLDENSIMGIVIGVTIGAFIIAVGLTWYFARDKITWLMGEAQGFAIRMTESAENLLDDLDFSDIRESFAARNNTRPEMSDIMSAGRPPPLGGAANQSSNPVKKYENPIKQYHSSTDLLDEL